MIHLMSIADIYKLCEEPSLIKLQVKRNLNNYKKLNLLKNGKTTNSKTKKS